jgi:CPA2 family monovalent cation:H+ antiporter-2
MHELMILRDLVVLVGIAIPVVALAQRVRVPTLVGFLLTGMAIGPHALRLIRDVESVRALAEIGVVLLLFAIGLELSLPRMRRLGRVLLQGGAVQVGGTIAVVALLALALGVPPPRALVFGALAALSSSAIVLKVYTDRGALDAPDGRIVIPIAVFQDLCIIPLVLLVELMGTGAADLPRGLGRTGLSLVVIAVLVLAGRFAVPWILARVARVRSRELFTLTIVFLGVAAAFVTGSVGLSLALGAFVAGLVISESPYGAQALADVIPFRDAFSGIFFASVGMLLDVRAVAADPLPFLAAAATVVVVKAVVASGAALSLRRPFEVSVTAGIALAQVGEFSFVLASIALPFGMIGPRAYQLFLGASVLTMLAAPFLIATARPVADRLGRLVRRAPAARAAESEPETASLSHHVIIVGYGVSGRNLARVLDGAGIPYAILEQNGQTVEQARAELQPIQFGDATRPEVLERAGIRRARALVFAISSPADEVRGVATARALSSTVHIIVRTRYVLAMENLRAAGANEVVPEEFETSLEIFSRVLRHFEIPANTIAREVEAARTELYGMALGRDAGPGHLEALAQLGVHHALEIVQVEPGAPAVGQHPVGLDVRHATGATIIAVVRNQKALYTPDAEFRFAAGDTVVLVGDEDALMRGRALFLAPPSAPGLAPAAC